MDKKKLENKNKSLRAFIFMLFSYGLESNPKFSEFMAQQVVAAKRGLQ